MKALSIHRAITLAVILFVISINPYQLAYGDIVTREDFSKESFAKTVDFYDYVRSYAATNGITLPSGFENWHAYLYVTYINTAGMKVFYTGLINITHGGPTFTLPMQSFAEVYRTQQGKQAIVASSFIALLAFKDSIGQNIPNAPDRNDTLYPSFSLGYDLTPQFDTFPKPSLSSGAAIIPLTSSGDKLTWTWGLRYTDLIAIWWRMNLDPIYPDYNRVPIAVTRYDELTFTYTLTVNPSARTATLTSNYVIGRMRDLWLFTSPFGPMSWRFLHYNSTGTYNPDRSLNSTATIYQYLQQQGVKMSIVNFQKSILVDRTTSDTSNTNQTVSDAESDVSSGSISTKADDGERIFESTFGTKKQYRLYNYTADSSEQTSASYDSITRTVKRAGYAGNPIFDSHMAFFRLMPLAIAHIEPGLFTLAKQGLLELTVANYFYIVSYPTYSGYKVAHDPTYTAFFEPSRNIGLLTAIFIAVAVAAAVSGILAFLLRRRRAASLAITNAPGQGPAPTGPPTPAR